MKLKIAQILLEEAHLKHRPDFLQRPATETPPTTAIGIRIEVAKAEDMTGAMVRLRVEADADKSPYLFIVSYLVLFEFEEDGAPLPEDLDRRLTVTGATMAFPFARECVANLTARGRFGPTWLSPTDFNTVVAAAPPPTANAG